MKHLAVFFLLTLPLAAFSQSKCARAVLDAEQRRFEAMVRADTVALRAMLADDLVYIHSNAMTESKDQHIADLSTGRLAYHSMERENARVRRYGKMAITNGVVKVNVTLDGKNLVLPLAYTAVYRKKKGRWLLVDWQSTRVP